MTTNREELVDSLSTLGLLAVEDVPSFRGEPLGPGTTLDAQPIAEELVRRGILTPHQAQVALQGRTEELVLGNYLILDRIGGGGMGEVFKARHRRMDRVVAIKVMKPEMLRSQGSVERFEREVRAAARLEHPHIVTAYDADEVGGKLFLVMQYVDGEDLQTRVQRAPQHTCASRTPCPPRGADRWRGHCGSCAYDRSVRVR